MYVLAAASFLVIFSGIDYRKDCNSDKNMGHILKPVYDDIDNWHTVPNRREPYTLKMHAEGQRESKLEAAVHPSNKITVLTNGFTAGLATGARLTEWAQPVGHSQVFNPYRTKLRGEYATRACIPDDFDAVTYDGRHCRGLSMLDIPVTDIHFCDVEHRIQKNGEHGEKRRHLRNKRPGGHCLPTAIYNQMKIYQAINQSASLPKDTPLFVYWDDTTSTARLPTANDIETYMRKLAVAVYDLHPDKSKFDKEAIQKWSAHSIRVGACCILHSQGCQPLDIQWLLRWKSLAFMAYLRNSVILAQKQIDAIDKAAAMPHLY
jgi:hypothetical protein